MPTSQAPQEIQARSTGRHWIGLGVKAGLAIAALTGVAHWTSRSTAPEAARLEAAARANDMDPVTTGSIRPRSTAPTRAQAQSPDAALDQRALTSLVARSQDELSRPVKKR